MLASREWQDPPGLRHLPAIPPRALGASGPMVTRGCKLGQWQTQLDDLLVECKKGHSLTSLLHTARKLTSFQQHKRHREVLPNVNTQDGVFADYKGGMQICALHGIADETCSAKSPTLSEHRFVSCVFCCCMPGRSKHQLDMGCVNLPE